MDVTKHSYEENELSEQVIFQAKWNTWKKPGK